MEAFAKIKVDETMGQKPSVYQYLDYREFIRDQMLFLKKDSKFSLRKFSATVGIKSTSFLSRVIQAKRNLTKETAFKIGLGLGLSKYELRFFEQLVQFNQTTDLVEKDQIFKEMLKFKSFRRAKMVEMAQYEQFSHWHILAIGEALGTSWAKKNVQEMAESMNLPVSKIEHAIQVLSGLGIIRKVHGNWQRVDAAVETPLQMRSLNVRNFHREMLQKALESVDGVAPEQRALVAITISLSHEKMQEVKKRIFDFSREINEIFSNDSKAHAVYQLNLQLFPLMKFEE